ncbi:ParE toxin of type II toxin-antitoxin system, parDE [anaerobic digester metagenome]
MERFTILWSDQAKVDLSEIIEYIAFEDKILALRILDKIEEIVTRLEQLPKSGRIVPELKAFNILTYREIVFSPWRIIYKITEDQVLIVSVLDSRRNLEDLLMKKLILK